MKFKADDFYMAVCDSGPLNDQEGESESIVLAAERLTDIWIYSRWDDGEDQGYGIDYARFCNSDNRYFVQSRDEQVKVKTRGEFRVACANYSLLRESLCSLLEKNCWNGIDVYPPSKIVAQLIRETFCFTQYLFLFESQTFSDDEVTRVQSNVDESFRQIEPTMAIFLASLTVAKLRKPKPNRNDSPSELELKNARDIVTEKQNIPHSALQKRMKISATKTTIILDALRNEGLYLIKKRKDRRKNTN